MDSFVRSSDPGSCIKPATNGKQGGGARGVGSGGIAGCRQHCNGSSWLLGLSLRDRLALLKSVISAILNQKGKHDGTACRALQGTQF